MTKAPAPARLIVTIDGPAGTGKSSVARLAAKRLGLEFLDTGAMYRAATALAIDRAIPLTDGAAIASLASQAALRFDWRADPPALLAFGADLSARLRDEDVDGAVSAVSSLPGVREVMVRLQRDIGRAHPRLLTEGRDQGSVVFPDADVKIYLDATLQARATRRVAQLRQQRPDHAVDAGAVERAIAERDHRDSHRPVGRLVCPPDATTVDTSAMTFDESVEAVVRIAHETLRRRGVADLAAAPAGAAD